MNNEFPHFALQRFGGAWKRRGGDFQGLLVRNAVIARAGADLDTRAFVYFHEPKNVATLVNGYYSPACEFSFVLVFIASGGGRKPLPLYRGKWQ